MRRGLVCLLSFVAVVALVGAPSTATSAVAPAIGAPGALSHFDLARKDCLGTARNRMSRVWYTVANGVLSDVYEPNVDTTNVETMQFLVTDGVSFTDLQSRDMTYTVSADRTGMVCTVTSTANSGDYRLTTTYLTDPSRNSVVVDTRLTALRGDRRALRLYVRIDPTIGGHGGGGTAAGQNAGADSATIDAETGALVSFDTNTVTAAVNRDYAQPTYLALRADRAFLEASSGYAGSPSDGLNQLDEEHELTDESTDAPDGNVVQTARLDTTRTGEARLVLGFGRTQAQAVGVAGATLGESTRALRDSYVAEWQAYDDGLVRPSRTLPGLSRQRSHQLAAAYYVGVNVLKASEDKQFPGAIVAAPASPWGQAVSAGTAQDGRAPYFGSYREVFSRDLYEVFTGMLVAGDVATARDTVRFLFERQQLADGRFPRNSLINGRLAPDSGGDQLDETAYPILMAWQAGLGGDAALYTDHIRKAADFLVARGPAFGSERWEEQSGYSPSTIASEIAGLVAAGRIAEMNGDPGRARLYRAVADHFQRSIKGWTVTTTGPYTPGPYFIRLSKTGDPNAAISYGLGNGGPTVDQRAVIDAGFQELTRLGALPADDPDVLRSLQVVDQVIARDTASGRSFYRYGVALDPTNAGTEDGYGDCYEPDATACDPTGKPWPGPNGGNGQTNQGSGHLWPVLSGERAEQLLQTGDRVAAAALLDALDRYSSGIGLVPEQAWENPDLAASPFGSPPETASIGFRNGGPAGSAAPLTWAQAQAVRLTLSIPAGRPLEQPAIVRARYVDAAPPPAAPLTVTAPPNGSEVTGASTTVTGSTVPAGVVDVAAANLDTGATALFSTVADGTGAFEVAVTVDNGVTALTTTVTAGTATGYDQRTVFRDDVAGTLLLDVTDPVGDDNGPGNFAYPTSGDFHAGAFDLERFQVFDTGSEIVLRARIRNLDATFGVTNGAQLLDLYVREPGVSPTSTAPAFPQRNYTIDPDSAWTQRIEVQGFAPVVWVRADGTGVPGATFVANSLSRTITVRVPKAQFGTPGSGWVFTVVLHGQDGFSPDQARGFAPTPEPFLFGVCAAPNPADPRCQVDPAIEPKAIDIIPPAGVDQATELDVTLGPVALDGIVIP